MNTIMHSNLAHYHMKALFCLFFILYCMDITVYRNQLIIRKDSLLSLSDLLAQHSIKTTDINDNYTIVNISGSLAYIESILQKIKEKVEEAQESSKHNAL